MGEAGRKEDERMKTKGRPMPGSEGLSVVPVSFLTLLLSHPSAKLRAQKSRAASPLFFQTVPFRSVPFRSVRIPKGRPAPLPLAASTSVTFYERHIL